MDLGHITNNVEVLSAIKVPGKYYERFETGIQILDEVFGGTDMPGILPGASVLFTGFPGAGKTTMTLQMADLFQKKGMSVLYNCGEQNKYIVKMNADRLGLSGNFAISQFGEVDDVIRYCNNNCVDLLIQDSLQTLKDGDEEGNKLIKKVGNKLAKFSSSTGIATFIVGHITKGGEFAGPMTIKHEVDVHAHLSFNKDTGNRIFELTKNRFGPAMVPYEFFMGTDGMDFREAQDVEANKINTRASQQKEACINKAKELLLKGDKLSGYSMDNHSGLVQWLEKEGYNISGGFWRGVLGKAAKLLEMEGNVLKTGKIDRREHVWVEG